MRKLVLDSLTLTGAYAVTITLTSDTGNPVSGTLQASTLAVGVSIAYDKAARADIKLNALEKLSTLSGFSVDDSTLPYKPLENGNDLGGAWYVLKYHVEVDDPDAWSEELEEENARARDKALQKQQKERVIAAEIEGYPPKKKPTLGQLLLNDSSLSSVSKVDDPGRRFVEVTLTDGTTILAEEFQYKGTVRYRQIQIRTNMPTLQGRNYKVFDSTRQGEAAFPLSILSGWDTDTLAIDADYNEDGSYEKGHLLRAAVGAPYNAFLIVPMLQYINKHGAWAEVEGLVERLLYEKYADTKRKVKAINCRAQPRANPYTDIERRLATLFFCCRYVEREPDWAMYTKCRLLYEGSEDPRVPSKLVFTIHRDKDGLRVWRPIVVEHSAAAVASAIGLAEQPSNALCAVFKKCEDLLAEEDRKIREGKKVPGQTEWDPIPWEVIDDTGLPPDRIPEASVPRPYRVLDFMFAECARGARSALAQQGAPETEIALFDEVASEQPASGLGFSSGQRKLAVLYNRYCNKGSFLSDLGPSALKRYAAFDLGATTPIGNTYGDYYQDPIGDTELHPGGGDNQPHADHHVPRQTGAGTNHFTNLLYVSKKQNLGAKAQTKPKRLTNPVSSRLKHGDKIVQQEITETKPKQATTGKDTVLRSIKKRTLFKSVEELAQDQLDDWGPEQLSILDGLLDAAFASWAKYLAEGGELEDVPWSERYINFEKSLDKMFH